MLRVEKLGGVRCAGWAVFKEERPGRHRGAGPFGIRDGPRYQPARFVTRTVRAATGAVGARFFDAVRATAGVG